MAGGAALLGHGGMFDFGIHVLIDAWIVFCVATLAKCLGVCDELIAVCRTMRVMAITAILGNRLVDVFAVKALFAILMTLEAEFPIGGRRDEQFFVFAGVWAVAGDTVTCPYRAVAVCFFENSLFVTVEAETAHCFAIAAELKTHF